MHVPVIPVIQQSSATDKKNEAVHCHALSMLHQIYAEEMALSISTKMIVAANGNRRMPTVIIRKRSSNANDTNDLPALLPSLPLQSLAT